MLEPFATRRIRSSEMTGRRLYQCSAESRRVRLSTVHFRTIAWEGNMTRKQIIAAIRRWELAMYRNGR